MYTYILQLLLLMMMMMIVRPAMIFLLSYNYFTFRYRLFFKLLIMRVHPTMKAGKLKPIIATYIYILSFFLSIYLHALSSTFLPIIYPQTQHILYINLTSPPPSVVYTEKIVGISQSSHYHMLQDDNCMIWFLSISMSHFPQIDRNNNTIYHVCLLHKL